EAVASADSESSVSRQAQFIGGSFATLRVAKMPLAEPPPRDSRFGSPLQLSRVHWVRPQIVVEVTYLLGRKTTCAKTSRRARLCGRFRIDDGAGPRRRSEPVKVPRLGLPTTALGRPWVVPSGNRMRDNSRPPRTRGR